MAKTDSSPIQSDGSVDWSGGVNSIKVPTVASDFNPNGLARNELAWLVNATVRDGGIKPRGGWRNKSGASLPAGINAYLLAQGLAAGYQFGRIYAPTGGASPYFMAVIGGHIFQIDPDFSYAPVDLSAQFGHYLPSTTQKAYWVQAEQWMVIQAGDDVTLPLIWDGTKLYRSNGITGTLQVGQPTPVSFQITTTAIALEGALGYLSAVIPLAAPYPGNLGDNLYITDTAQGYIGHFRVIQLGTGNNSIVLQSQALPGAAANIAIGTYICTLENALATNAGPYPNPAGSVANVAIGDGSWTLPAVGKNVTLPLLTPYFGEVGDTIVIQSLNGLITYGQFNVVSFNDSPETVVTLTQIGNIPVGTLIVQTELVVSIIAVRTYANTWESTDWTVPPAGQSVAVTAVRFTPAYAGVVGDYVMALEESYGSGQTIGLFRYLGAIAPGAETGAGSLMQCVNPNGTAGYVFSGNIKWTVVGPGAGPTGGFAPVAQNLVIGAGTWSVPPVGKTVALQIFWNYPTTGVLNTYPGNVGDTITLTNNSPTYTIGTFIVTAFDGNGGITLKTVSSAVQGTASGTFNGPVMGNIGGTTTIPPSITGTLINQIPAAQQMIYYMGRIFYNQNGVTNAGDIVGGPSGTSAYGFQDSVLSVTENPLVIGGDGFTLPTQSGAITGYSTPNTIDASLGQGLLLISTNSKIYALSVPVSRADWIGAGSNNQPQLVEVQFDKGFASDTGVISVNGDLYYNTTDPGIRSFVQATRLFSEAGNTPMSAEENRILQFTNTALSNMASGANFDNRLLMTALPVQTPFGVVHQAILPNDFTPISTARDRKPPVWEGHLEGLQVLQLATAMIAGVNRCFAIVLSQNANLPGAIELWELTTGDYTDDGDNRVTWQIEFPAFTWGEEFSLKELVAGELWADSIYGTVEFFMEYRPDGDQCWKPWMKWQNCAARNYNERNVNNPQTYPVEYCKGYQQTMTLAKPPVVDGAMGRPANIGYQFQVRLTITGYCRVRGLLLHCEPRGRKLYERLVTEIGKFCNYLKTKWL